MVNYLLKTTNLIKSAKILVRSFPKQLIKNERSGYTQKHLYLSNQKVLNLPNKNLINIKNLSLKYRMTQKPKVIFVLGGPGAGKGTQCQKIVDEYDFVHLSAGDLLRAERARSGSEYGEMIEDCITNGKIVPVEVTCSLLDNAMQEYMQKYGKYKFLIDGFPRNQDNLDGWNRKMSEKVDFLTVLFFECDQQICIDRCLARGKAGSGRSDDNEESMKKRINTYLNDSLPIIEYYKKQDKVCQIDAGPNPDIVFESIKSIFKKIN